MRRRALFVFVGAGLTAVVACTSFSATEAPPSTSPEAGDAPTPTPTPDAATSEASTTDSAPPVDAGATSCALYPKAAFCDDFNNGQWDARWHLFPPAAPGLTVATTSSWPSKELSVTTSNIDPGPRLVRDLSFAVPTAHVRIDFVFHAEAFDPASSVTGAIAAFGPTGIDNLPHVRLELNANRLVLVAFQPPTSYSTLATSGVPSGPARLSMLVDYTTTSVTASFLLDGTMVGAKALPATFPTPTSPSIYLGLSFLSGSASAWTLRFDDYVLTTTQ